MPFDLDRYRDGKPATPEDLGALADSFCGPYTNLGRDVLVNQRGALSAMVWWLAKNLRAALDTLTFLQARETSVRERERAVRYAEGELAELLGHATEFTFGDFTATEFATVAGELTWIVRRDGDDGDIAFFPTRDEAIALARRCAAEAVRETGR